MYAVVQMCKMQAYERPLYSVEKAKAKQMVMLL